MYNVKNSMQSRNKKKDEETIVDEAGIQQNIHIIYLF